MSASVGDAALTIRVTYLAPEMPWDRPASRAEVVTGAIAQSLIASNYGDWRTASERCARLMAERVDPRHLDRPAVLIGDASDDAVTYQFAAVRP